MCGICGEFQFQARSGAVDPSTLEDMMGSLRHRGPDDDGRYLSEDRRLGLGFRRLSIVDLATGAQPMANEDGSVWLVFNGEIYNHLELRRRLEEQGHVFRTRSDTECLVHLYEEVGVELVHQLRGMFAFALWDARERRLFLARDRLGVKPLYYRADGNGLVFASEIKALLRHPWISAQVDDASLHHYLTFATTPVPDTLFKSISKLPPAHRLLVQQGGEPLVERYWDPLDAAAGPRVHVGEHDYVERLRELLRDSVRLRMMSDVPFGVFLSGGIDSSLNVALMSELMDRPVDTFSVAMEGQRDFDELSEARFVAETFGANHHEVVIGEQEFLDALPSVVYHQDEPLADPVCVPLYYLARLTRESGTIVVQVGEGSDELFCGYGGYAQYLQFHRRFWQPYTALPPGLRRAAYGLFGPLLSSVRRDFMCRGATGGELFWGGAIAFWELEKEALLSSEFRVPSSAMAPPRNSERGTRNAKLISAICARFDERLPQADFLDRMIHLELALRLPELLLMRVDKMTMAHSVEARVPFLDHKLVEFALSVPAELKLRNGTTKYLLKQAARGLVPDRVIQRKKMGFCGSAANMLTPRLIDAAERDVLSSPVAAEYFNLDYLRQLFAGARRGADNNFKIWNLWNLVLWHRAWIEGEAAVEAASAGVFR